MAISGSKLVASGIFEVPPPTITPSTPATPASTASSSSQQASTTATAAVPAKPNPVSPFATTAQGFQIPPRPKLSERMTKQVPTKQEIMAHEIEDEQWRQSLQRLIAAQFARFQSQVPKS